MPTKSVNKEKLALKPGEILVLRTCGKNGTSKNGFVWPLSGAVEAPDWKDTDACGNGLHGLPWGVGGTSYLSWNENRDNGWVVKVDTAKGNYQHGSGDMADKCKFRAGVVVFGNAKRDDCIAFVEKYIPPDLRLNYRNQNDSGGSSTQTAGGSSTQTAGDESTQKAGGSSTQKAGWKSTQKAGWKSTQKAGDESTQKAGLQTVQIVSYYNGDEWIVKTRVIGKDETDQWYKFQNGDWRRCTPEEEEVAEGRTK